MTLMPSLIDNTMLTSGNALYTGFVQAGSMLGPVIGGILVATNGPALAFAVDAGSYLVSATCLSLVGRSVARRSQPGPGEAPPTEQTASTASTVEPVAGSVWTLLRRDRFLRIVPVVPVTANFALTGTTEVTLPVLAHARYGAAGFGAVLACIAVMSIVGALAVAWGGDRFAGGFQVAAVAIAAAPFLGGLPGLAVGLSVFGLALGFDNAVWGTLIQRWGPPDLLGRVRGVLMLAPAVSFPLSTLIAGVLTMRPVAVLAYPRPERRAWPPRSTATAGSRPAAAVRPAKNAARVNLLGPEGPSLRLGHHWR